MSGDPGVMCFLLMNCPASTGWRWLRPCLIAVLGFSRWPTETGSIRHAIWSVCLAPTLNEDAFPVSPVRSLPAPCGCAGEPWHLA